MTDIITLQPGDANFNLFENFVCDIYDAGQLALKPNEKINVEYLQRCFLLLVDGKVKCRCALYDNPSLFYKEKKAVCVGNYESVNDKKISKTLLDHVAVVAKKARAQFLIGPMNGSTWDDYRFSMHHQYHQFFSEAYHHLYYNEHFLHNGFASIGNYYSSIETELDFDNPVVEERKKQLLQSGVVFRNINWQNFEAELERIYEFNLNAFKTNFLYTPITLDGFKKKYLAIQKLINPEFVIIADDAEHNMIGYIFCIDDFYNEKQKSLIVKTIARHPDKKWSGTGHVLGSIIFERALQQHYVSIIHSFMYEAGTSVAMSKNFSGDIFKNYVLYGKEL